MMVDLAAHILDISYNALRANAQNIEIDYIVNDDSLSIMIIDDGCGMDDEMLDKVTNPFYSTRSVRKIGLGLAFLNDLATFCNGSLNIQSQINYGTSIHLVVEKNHIDLPPLGDMGEAIMLLIQANPNIEYYFKYQVNQNQFIFDTKIIKDTLQEISIDDYQILDWIKTYINENIKF